MQLHDGMQIRRAIVALCAVMAACDESKTPKEAEAANEPAVAKPPSHEAKAPAESDAQLRELLAGMASAQACKRIKDTYVSLPSPEAPDRVSGTLWIRECSIENDGTTLRFHFEGDGWQWVERESESAGADFAVRQYARFHVAATLVGTVDMAYRPNARIATVWFETTQKPAVKFEPIGEIAVDEDGTWSSIVGAVAGVVSDSPEERAKDTVKKEGTQSFVERLAKGMTVTVDACSGEVGTELGILRPGKKAPKGAGETLAVDIAIEPGGLMIVGPQEIDRTHAIEVEGFGGEVQMTVACMDEAAKLADAYFHARPMPTIDALAVANVRGRMKVKVKKAKCPVAVIAQTKAGDAGMSFARRPPSHTPLIDCPPKKSAATARR